MTLQSLSQAGKGGAGIPDQIPAALKELQGLSFNVLTGVGAATKINVTGLLMEDTIVAAVMSATGVLSDIKGTATIEDLRATGTITIGTVVNTNNAVVNGKTYTFKTTGENKLLRELAILATPTLNAAALAAAINLHDPITLVASASGAVVTIFARANGTAGNSITTTSSANVTSGAATLAGGSATGGVKFSGSTSGNTILLAWFNKQ